jgi:hypothetical protein
MVDIELPTLPEPPKVSEKLPRLKEKVEGPMKEVLGEKGPGKIIGDIVTSVLGVGDSVVVGVTKTVEGILEIPSKRR